MMCWRLRSVTTIIIQNKTKKNNNIVILWTILQQVAEQQHSNLNWYNSIAQYISGQCAKGKKKETSQGAGPRAQRLTGCSVWAQRITNEGFTRHKSSIHAQVQSRCKLTTTQYANRHFMHERTQRTYLYTWWLSVVLAHVINSSLSLLLNNVRIQSDEPEEPSACKKDIGQSSRLCHWSCGYVFVYWPCGHIDFLPK